MVAATTTPGHHHVRDLDEDDDDNHLTNGDTSRDLRMDSDEIVGELVCCKTALHKCHLPITPLLNTLSDT